MPEIADQHGNIKLSWVVGLMGFILCVLIGVIWQAQEYRFKAIEENLKQRDVSRDQYRQSMKDELITMREKVSHLEKDVERLQQAKK
jgi:uncharacterized membrane-anchored protein YhcB (DUF1043 family)